MPENNGTLDWLERATKLSAFVLLCIYAVGFLVTSLYFSSYGVAHINPIRPRVFGAGLLLAGISIAAYFNGIASFKLPQHGIEYEGLARAADTFLRIGGCVFGAEALAAFSISMADIQPGGEPHFGLLFISSMALLVVGNFVFRTSASPNTLRKIVALISGFAVTSLLSVYCDQWWSYGFTKIAAWLAIVSITGVGVRWVVQSPTLSPTINVLSLVAELGFFVTTFTAWIYPHIRAEWGGGAPVQVVVTYSKDAGYLAGRVTPALLLDESDDGFYVVDRNTKHTYFIPRASVALLDFYRP